MADVFVTLVSVQPAVAVVSTTRVPQQNRPQGDGRTFGGAYEVKRKNQTNRGKRLPPGAG